jgi:hypothetical protein
MRTPREEGRRTAEEIERLLDSWVAMGVLTKGGADVTTMREKTEVRFLEDERESGHLN